MFLPTEAAKSLNLAGASKSNEESNLVLGPLTEIQFLLKKNLGSSTLFGTVYVGN